MKPKKLKTWVCEQKSRAVSTLLVEAASRKEAQAALDLGFGKHVDLYHYSYNLAKVIREDKPKRK